MHTPAVYQHTKTAELEDAFVPEVNVSHLWYLSSKISLKTTWTKRLINNFLHEVAPLRRTYRNRNRLRRMTTAYAQMLSACRATNFRRYVVFSQSTFQNNFIILTKD